MTCQNSVFICFWMQLMQVMDLKYQSNDIKYFVYSSFLFFLSREMGTTRAEEEINWWIYIFQTKYFYKHLSKFGWYHSIQSVNQCMQIICQTKEYFILSFYVSVCSSIIFQLQWCLLQSSDLPFLFVFEYGNNL